MSSVCYLQQSAFDSVCSQAFCERYGMMQTDGKPTICFVALNAYNLLSGREDIGHIGGAEVQQVRMALWLAARGFPVSFVTLDHGQPDGVSIGGIRVFKAYSQGAGIRGLRFFWPRWSGLWHAMARANADVYYQRGAGCETGQVAVWCHMHGRKFVFAAAHDSNWHPGLLARNHSFKERILYRVGLSLADAVTVQTRTQQCMFERNMGLATVLIRNCGWESLGKASARPWVHSESAPLRVLWIGRISRQKRVEWLLDLAVACPSVVFEVVGGANSESSYEASIRKRAEGISNVRMRGRTPYAEMAQYYSRCHLLCCTSACEGFPNTFLEAWSSGVPLLSTFDPDGVISENKLGWVANDVCGLVSCLKGVITSPKDWIAASNRVIEYYQSTHTQEVCLPQLQDLLVETAGR